MTFQTLIDQWPTLADFARDVRAPYERARKWRERNSIPSKYWPDIVRAARRQGVPGATIESLAMMAATADLTASCSVKCGQATEGEAAA